VLVRLAIEDRHEEPGHKPVRTPTDKLISMSGERDELGREIPDARDELMGSFSVEGMDEPDT
jgi:hypothetical protein